MLKCPVCVTWDLKVSDRHGIEIDFCPNCRGIWLDKGELDKIISRAAALEMQYLQAQAPAPPEPPRREPREEPSSQPRYEERRRERYEEPRRRYDDNDDDDHRYDNRRYDDRYDKKRKVKSFLDEVFDIFD